MKKILVAVLTLGIIGCSTSPVALNKAKDAPANRAIKYQSHREGDAKLIVIRDSGITGSGCYAAVFVNGEKSAQLDTAEKITLNMPAGEYVIGTALDGSGWCSMGKERQERSVTLKNQNETVVRIFSDGSGNLDIKPSTL